MISFHGLCARSTCLFLVAVGAWQAGLESLTAGAAPTPLPDKVTICDADPEHLWNRIHGALYLRTAIPGHRIQARAELDPPIWPDSDFLLKGAGHRRAISLLDEFLTKHGENLFRDALKRALLQRDLWAVFDWVADPTDSTNLEHYESQFLPERRALEMRLAKAIGRLALTSQEIRALPDNYAAAVAARAFPAAYPLPGTPENPLGSKKPVAPFLPADLLEAQGGWVLLGDARGEVMASKHAAFFGGRSVFFPFLHLPGGRQATREYVAKVRTFPDPVVPAEDGRLLRINPALPAFPVWSQLVLLRRMTLINDQGRITPTHLTESVQLRVYTENDSDPEQLVLRQDFYEFRLQRQALFAGLAGGLVAVVPTDLAFDFQQSLGLTHNYHDPFATTVSAKSPGPATEAQTGFASKIGPILKSCAGCHGLQGNKPGMHAVDTFVGHGELRKNARGEMETALRPPDLIESEPKQEERVTLQKNHPRGYWIGHYSTELLQALLQDKPWFPPPKAH